MEVKKMIRTKTKIPREWLEKAAIEITDTMGLKPEIPLDAEDDKIKKMIQGVAAFVEDGDEFTALAWLLMGFEDEKFSIET
jgi:hypothetical protein